MPELTLREIEAQWLKVCRTHTCAQVEALVRQDRQGTREAEFHQFTMTLSLEVNQLLLHAMRHLSEAAGRTLQLVEALEYLCADYLAQHGPTSWG